MSGATEVAFAFALARDLAADLDLDLDCDRGLAGGLARHLAAVLDSASARTAVLPLDRDLVRSRALGQVLLDARDSAAALALALDSAHHRDLAGTLARDLGPVRAHARDLVRTVAAAFDLASPDRQHVAEPIRSVSRPIRTMVAIAVRVLPADERPRWKEEFKAELGDLVMWRRFPYAARLLSQAISLRRGLRHQRAGSPAIGG